MDPTAAGRPPRIGCPRIGRLRLLPPSWWLRPTQGVEANIGILRAGTWTHRKLGLTVAETVAMEWVVRVCATLLLGIAGAVMGLWVSR